MFSTLRQIQLFKPSLPNITILQSSIPHKNWKLQSYKKLNSLKPIRNPIHNWVGQRKQSNLRFCTSAHVYSRSWTIDPLFNSLLLTSSLSWLARRACLASDPSVTVALYLPCAAETIFTSITLTTGFTSTSPLSMAEIAPVVSRIDMGEEQSSLGRNFGSSEREK